MQLSQLSHVTDFVGLTRRSPHRITLRVCGCGSLPAHIRILAMLSHRSMLIHVCVDHAYSFLCMLCMPKNCLRVDGLIQYIRELAMEKSIPKTTMAWFIRGLRNGIPICAGYFAVSFAMGIAAKNAGMNAVQSFVMSLTMVASAGQFAAINLIASGAGIIEMITTSLIVNLRYFLMSCSLTQKLNQKTNPVHRFLLAYCMTDEIFGLSVTVDGDLNPFYTYGITAVSVAGWCSGTVIGVLAGNILPVWASNALGVAMYGMFLAIIIPPARDNSFIGWLVAVSMLASWFFSVMPGLKAISSGFRIIILTIVLAGIAAAVKPVEETAELQAENKGAESTEGEGNGIKVEGTEAESAGAENAETESAGAESTGEGGRL